MLIKNKEGGKRNMRGIKQFLLVLCTALVLAGAVLATGGSTDGPASGVVYDGSAAAVKFNCTAYVTSSDPIVLANVSLWTNFTGDWAYTNGTTSVTNNSQTNITYNLPATQGVYIWNCLVSDNVTLNTAVNSSNQTLYVDTTAPTLTLTAGTVQNGSVLIAGTLGGLYFHATDTGGGTVDEATSYGSVKLQNGSSLFDITWSSDAEGHFEADIDNDLDTDNQTGQTLMFDINFTDSVGNVQQGRYAIVWDNDPSDNYASDFNYTAHAGTNLAQVNVSDAGLISPIALTLNNSYGQVVFTSVWNATGYDMNLNQRGNFSYGTIALAQDILGVSGQASLTFRGLTFLTTPGVYKDSLGCTVCGDVTYSGGVASFTTSSFSTYTLYSQDPEGGSGGIGGAGGYAVCGDGVCSSPIETADNCPMDCGQGEIEVTPTPSGDDGFVDVPADTTPVTTPTIEDKDKSKKIIVVVGAVMVLLAVLLLIVALLPTKSGSKRRRRRR